MIHRLLRVPLILFFGVLAVACGGGGGGSSGSGAGGKNFQVFSGPTGTTIPGLNSSVLLVFNKAIDEDSISPASVNLVTVSDPTGLSSQPPGILASVTFEVDDTRLFIRPTIEFSAESVSYGFAESALYEVTFAPPGSGNEILSTKNKALTNPEASFFFRTPNKAADPQAGFPLARAFFVDDGASVVLPDVIADGTGDANTDPIDEALALFPGSEELLGGGSPLPIPGSPFPDIVVAFNEAVIPSTVFNAIDGSSPSVRVLVNTVALPDFAPVIAPGEIVFLKQQTDLTLVLLTSEVEAMPPGGFVRLEVAAGVQDLACNSKFSVTQSITPLVRIDFTVSSTLDPTLYELTEPFETTAQQDIQFGSGAWGSDVYTPVLAGGLGTDGPLILGSASTLVPVGGVLDTDAKVLQLPTVRANNLGERVPRRWQFSRITIPSGWTVEPRVDADGDGLADFELFQVALSGHPLDGRSAPLQLYSTGLVDIGGVVRANGTDGALRDLPDSQGDASFAAYLAQGAPGAVGGGGAGGEGGAVLMLDDLGAIGLPLASPETDGNLAFNASDGKLRGVTGRSETLDATTLVDDDVDLSILTDPMLGMGGQSDLFALLEAGRILLQPNVGIGSSLQGNTATPNQFIDENHPTFVVESVAVNAGSSTITVASGSMVQASLNFGDGVNSFHPIAAGGDSYLVGPLAGAQGSDPAGYARGGIGGPPYVVVNEGALGITTTSGGGGGGGGVQPGAAGESDGPAPNPLANERGTTGGISLDAAAGAPGGAGAPRGTGMVVNGTEYDLISQTSGTPLSSLDPANLVGGRLLPNSPDDGWGFRVIAFNDPTFELEPLDVVTHEIDLLTGPAGFAGPGLSGGQTTNFLLLPPDGGGGSGGGGSGVSVTGTQNVTASTLPRLSPGVGGGSGGGSLQVETPGQFTLRSSAVLSANGGVGGAFDDNQLMLAGAGGGAGGEVRLGAGSFQLFQNAQVGAQGGLGGGVSGIGKGGQGGEGWVRFETLFADPTLAPFLSLSDNTLQNENVGRLVGQPRSGAQSRFYDVGLVNPEFESVVVTYSADIDDDGTRETGLSWTLDLDGVDGGLNDLVNPPFLFSFNSVGVGVDGNLDPSAAPPRFYEAYDLIIGRSGLVFDAVNDGYLYLAGEAAELVRCLEGGCASALVPPIAGSAAPIDIVSMALGGPDDELFLLERATGKVHVMSRQGLFRRTIQLPYVIEGAMTYRTSLMGPDDDQLAIVDNHTNQVLLFPARDLDAMTPGTTNFSPDRADEIFSVTRDGDLVALSVTGMAHDPVADTLWLLDGPDGRLLEVSLVAGMEGESNTGVEIDTRFTFGGEPVMLSALALGDGELRITRSVDPLASTVFGVDVMDLNSMGADLELPSLGTALPEISRSIADGDGFLRFRLAVDGTFVDPMSGVSFRDVVIDEVRVGARNQGF
ncbi:MAG: hypothetical protein DHS20C15_22230 [Planctomycetota bacterium]|nr:MAG: hypothetical protein DHS20C15_22230 [Planctomycetota bacterium]